MHVGILCEHSAPDRGGAERYLAALAERLRVHGHVVTIAARTGPCARNVRSWPRALRPRHYARTLLPFLRDAGAARILTTSPVPGCDFYQPHHGIFAAAMPPRLEPLPAALRVVRGLNPTRRLHFAVLSAFEARAVARPTTVLALSPLVERDLHEHYPSARCVLTRPGVDLQRFAPGPRPGDGTVLLFVARNFRLKGLATAVAATEELRDCRLRVVGRGRPLRAPRVEYLGDVADMPQAYRAADVLVHPTYYDTAALVVLEALASGIPAITTRRDGNADLAVQGGGAALERPGDATALAAAVREVLASSDAGRARAVAERFSQDVMLDQVVELLTCAD